MTTEKIEVNQQTKTKEKFIPSTIKTSNTLVEGIEENVLVYCINTPFDSIICEINTDLINPAIFTENSIHKEIITSLTNIWTSGKGTSIEEIALGCKNKEYAFQLLQKLKIKTVSYSNINDHLKILNDKYLKNVIQQELTKSKNGKLPDSELFENIKMALDSSQIKTYKTQSQDYYLDSILTELENAKSKIIPTGIKSLDQLLDGGFQAATITSLTGGAGSGKSAFAMQITDSVAMQGKTVLYISMEIKRSKLTERSLKRIYYLEYKSKKINIENPVDRRKKAAEKYKEFCKNVIIIEGHEGMTVFELQNIITRVTKKAGEELLVIIDPFQRLGTGDLNLDATNETLKVNKLISAIKHISNDLNIPILILCDTTKAHGTTPSAEGKVRGSYMVDHTVDCNIMLRTDNEDPKKALCGGEENKNLDNEVENVLVEIKRNTQLDKYDKWAAITTSKQRDSAIFNLLFVYRPAYHYFEDTTLHENTIKEEIF